MRGRNRSVAAHAARLAPLRAHSAGGPPGDRAHRHIPAAAALIALRHWHRSYPSSLPGLTRQSIASMRSPSFDGMPGSSPGMTTRALRGRWTRQFAQARQMGLTSSAHARGIGQILHVRLRPPAGEGERELARAGLAVAAGLSQRVLGGAGDGEGLDETIVE